MDHLWPGSQKTQKVNTEYKNKNGVKRRNEIANTYKRAFKGKIKFQSLPNNRNLK